ncbi:MAG TPA: hypothetical protein VLJ21_03505 [Candidatus Binatia bacterium]|nr:hypothetical protein [Candidatus Binatia bacterium]
MKPYLALEPFLKDVSFNILTSQPRHGILSAQAKLFQDHPEQQFELTWNYKNGIEYVCTQPISLDRERTTTDKLVDERLDSTRKLFYPYGIHAKRNYAFPNALLLQPTNTLYEENVADILNSKGPHIKVSSFDVLKLLKKPSGKEFDIGHVFETGHRLGLQDQDIFDRVCAARLPQPL